MDEELEQPNNKINLDSFFKSIESVEKLANNALNIANSNLNVIQQQKSLIDAISISLTNLQTEVREINNTIIVEKKLAEDRQEDLRLENEDREQKQMASERLEGQKGEKGDTGQPGESQDQPTPKTGLLGKLGALLTLPFTGLAAGATGLLSPLEGIGTQSLSGLDSKEFREKTKTKSNLDSKESSGIFGGIFDSLTGNKKDKFKSEIKSELKQELNLTNERKGEKVVGGKEGEKRGIKGVIGGVADRVTGGFFDFDKRGNTKTQDFQQGFVDALTGNLTDFDRKGGKTVGPTRVATGMIDFATANMFDLDKRGGLDLFGFGKRRKKRQKSNYDNNPRVIANKKKIDELRSKTDQLEMETIINPDGSITSKGSGTLVGGELYKPGEEMSLKQRQATQIKIMINGEGSVDPQRLEDYKNSGGSLSKEEISQINDLEGVEPGAFTEVSDEEAKRQIEAEDNPFAGILSPFVDKFKNFSEGLEKSSLGESLKDEKIPKQLESVAKDIGSKIDPKDIKDVVIKTVVKKLFGDIEPGAFSPVSDEDIEREKQLESDGKTFELSGASKKLIGGDEDFLESVKEISEKRGINQSEFLGLMASESSLDPKAVNKDTGATGLIQFLPEVAESLGTTTDKILEMSRAEQVKLIDKYFDMNKLPDNPTAGQLKTNVLMPAYTDKDDDFELMTKFKKFTDGEAGNPNTFSQNKGLDYNEDGFVTVGEAGESIMKKMKEFGIKDITPQKGEVTPILENKLEDLTNNILSNPAINISQNTVSPQEIVDQNAPTIVQADAPQVTDVEIKATKTFIPFMQLIQNEQMQINIDESMKELAKIIT